MVRRNSWLGNGHEQVRVLYLDGSAASNVRRFHKLQSCDSSSSSRICGNMLQIPVCFLRCVHGLCFARSVYDRPGCRLAEMGYVPCILDVRRYGRNFDSLCQCCRSCFVRRKICSRRCLVRTWPAIYVHCLRYFRGYRCSLLDCDRAVYVSLID